MKNTVEAWNLPDVNTVVVQDTAGNGMVQRCRITVSLCQNVGEFQRKAPEHIQKHKKLLGKGGAQGRNFDYKAHINLSQGSFASRFGD